jgi:hypothetical protein
MPRPVTAAGGEGILQSLPQPPDLPASLYAPAPPPSPGCNPLDVPYFVPDPLLDPPQLPPPGWFAALELDVLKPHLTPHNMLIGSETVPGVLTVPSAPLDWAASPRALLGYRLPSGFGEVAVVYRGLGTRGSKGFEGADGPAALNSRLDFNIIDLDYSSREFSLWPKWDMKWTVGARTQFIFFDSRLDQPFGPSAAGGTLPMRQTLQFTGAGPHLGLELARRLAMPGVSVVFRGDLASVFGRLHQGFFTPPATPGPGGLPPEGEFRVANNMTQGIVYTQLGVSWQPPSYPDLRLFLGYQYEYWWNVGTSFEVGSRGDFWDQGFALQAALRF